MGINNYSQLQSGLNYKLDSQLQLDSQLHIVLNYILYSTTKWTQLQSGLNYKVDSTTKWSINWKVEHKLESGAQTGK